MDMPSPKEIGDDIGPDSDAGGQAPECSARRLRPLHWPLPRWRSSLMTLLAASNSCIFNRGTRRTGEMAAQHLVERCGHWPDMQYYQASSSFISFARMVLAQGWFVVGSEFRWILWRALCSIMLHISCQGTLSATSPHSGGSVRTPEDLWEHHLRLHRGIFHVMCNAKVGHVSRGVQMCVVKFLDTDSPLLVGLWPRKAV